MAAFPAVGCTTGGIAGTGRRDGVTEGVVGVWISAGNVERLFGNPLLFFEHVVKDDVYYGK
jgi:hypothetical protein